MSSSVIGVIYEEPTLPVLLTLSSFLYLLQVSRYIADALLSAGLLGEIALGVIYGSPLSGILEHSWEETWLVVGYWGLVLIVFEGGLDFDARLFLSCLPLATIAAFTGVLLPMALSFAVLSGVFKYSALHAFSCGAALASDSLGTTFSILRAQSDSFDVMSTRIGSVIMGAALVDDVIALVLLSVIDGLGNGVTTSLGWTIGRPIVASVALAVLGPAVTYLFARPLYGRFIEKHIIRLGGNAALSLGLCVLSAHLAIAYYAGSTVLLGSFLAGVMLSVLPSDPESESYRNIFHRMVGPVHKHIFSPLFFASIGYSIPFLDLFTITRFWQGLVFAIFMTLGKLVVGFWIPIAEIRVRRRSSSAFIKTDSVGSQDVSLTEKGADKNSRRMAGRWTIEWPAKSSIAPAMMLSTAMVARGEIGILILQVGYASSLVPTGLTVISEDVYLIGVWAVLICTIIGPITFSSVIRRSVSTDDRREVLVRSRWGQGIGYEHSGEDVDNHGVTEAHRGGDMTDVV